MTSSHDEHHNLHDSLSVITLNGTIHYATDLSCHQQALKVTKLYTPGRKELFVEDLVVETTQLQTALAQ